MTIVIHWKNEVIKRPLTIENELSFKKEKDGQTILISMNTKKLKKII